MAVTLSGPGWRVSIEDGAGWAEITGDVFAECAAEDAINEATGCDVSLTGLPRPLCRFSLNSAPLAQTQPSFVKLVVAIDAELESIRAKSAVEAMRTRQSREATVAQPTPGVEPPSAIPGDHQPLSMLESMSMEIDIQSILAAVKDDYLTKEACSRW